MTELVYSYEGVVMVEEGHAVLVGLENNCVIDLNRWLNKLKGRSIKITVAVDDTVQVYTGFGRETADHAEST